LVVIGLVTAKTAVWCAVVIAIVTIHALVGNRQVCALQHIVVAVNREGGRVPVGIGRVAFFAGVGYANGRMIRVTRLVVLGGVTAKAGIGCVVVIILVTGKTVGGNAQVSACQRVIVFMDREGGRLPARLGGVTGFAGVWYANRLVIGVGSLVKLVSVAIAANGGGAGVAIGMTSNAIHCGMRTG